MQNNEMISLLTILLGLMIGILVILSIVFIILSFKNRQKNKGTKTSKKEKKDNKNNIQQKPKTFTKESIFKFMEFDGISDNMIVQKDGKRFLMVIECQGINFDLMSGLEKNSVEQGFLQFLNTLRYPIQIYIQTRTVNLGSSIESYKERIENVSSEYNKKQLEYNQKVRSGQYTEKQLEKERYELVRYRNLYEYGLDIVNNTEKMSLNRNILSKHYFIIIPHYSEEAAEGHYDKEEVLNIAFSELYTKAQALISSLAVCGVNGKILNSNDLTELLYIAYNRDESEIFDLRRALNSGYEDLYSTAPDVFDKRMKELDRKIEQEAIIKANDIVQGVMEESEKQRKARQRESELDNLIDEMAKALIEENKPNLGQDIAEKAVKKIEDSKKEKTNEKEKGGEEDGKKPVAKRRRITKSV